MCPKRIISFRGGEIGLQRINEASGLCFQLDVKCNGSTMLVLSVARYPNPAIAHQTKSLLNKYFSVNSPAMFLLLANLPGGYL